MTNRRTLGICRSIALALLLASACGGAQTPGTALLPAASVAIPPASSAPPPAEVNAEPTVLTAAQRARDETLKARAAGIVDAYQNTTGSYSSLVARLTRDGKHMLFGSTRDGLGQIYVGDVQKPSEAPRALTSGSERSIWADFTADEKHVLFIRDEGADEKWCIWRVGLDGSGATNLTPGEKLHRGTPVLPHKKPDVMYYTARSTGSPATSVYKQGISGGDPVKVYEDPAPAFAVDVTADGSRVLLVRWVSSSDLVLIEVDTSGKTPAARIYPSEGTKAGIASASYSADGKRIFVGTDEGKESFGLLALDAKSHAEKGRWMVDAPSTASIGDIQVSPKGDRLAVMIDAGNRSEIRVLDAKKLTVQRTVAAPPGMIVTGRFTEDGKSFSYWQSTPDHPADVFLANAATGESKPLRADKRPELEGLAPLRVTVESVKAHDGLTIPVNLYLPQAVGGTKMPVLVMFHGGPSSSSPIRWSAFTRFFTAQGYAVVEPNIRGSTGFGRAYEMADDREKRGDVLKDMETVNAWTKAQPWSDPTRVIIYGGSYGGYVTLMGVTRQPGLWRAGVDVFGVVNLKTFLRSTDQAIRAGFVQEFGDLEKDDALLDEYSPSRDFGRIVSPLFVYAGQNDPRVPRSESDQIVVALRSRGVPVEYMVAANEGHSLDRRETKIEFMARVVRFLDEQVNGGAAGR